MRKLFLSIAIILIAISNVFAEPQNLAETTLSLDLSQTGLSIHAGFSENRILTSEITGSTQNNGAISMVVTNSPAEGIKIADRVFYLFYTASGLGHNARINLTIPCFTYDTNKLAYNIQIVPEETDDYKATNNAVKPTLAKTTTGTEGEKTVEIFSGPIDGVCKGNSVCTVSVPDVSGIVAGTYSTTIVLSIETL